LSELTSIRNFGIKRSKRLKNDPAHATPVNIQCHLFSDKKSKHQINKQANNLKKITIPVLWERLENRKP